MKNSDKKSGIYQIRNLVNGRRYFGSSINVIGRIKEHKKLLKSERHENDFLQHDYIKSGREQFFVYEILLECPIEMLLIEEQKYLDKFWDGKKMCYNILPTAGNNLGYKHTDATKKLISEGNKGKIVSDETKQLMSETSARQRKVNQYDLTGKYITTFKTLNEAFKETNVRISKISSCCSGHRRSSGKFLWKYWEDFQDCKNIDPYEEYISTRKVKQFTLEGIFVKEYSSIKEAQKTLKIFGIVKSCQNENKTAGGFMWKYSNECFEPIISPYEENKTSSIKVIQCDLNGQEIREFNNISEASNTLIIGFSKISKCCLGQLENAGGFKWKYASPFIVMEKHSKKDYKILQEIIKKTNNGINNGNSKKVAQYDLNGNLIKIWDYMSEAAKKTGTNLASMSSCCSGKNKTANGFIWKLLENSKI